MPVIPKTSWRDKMSFIRSCSARVEAFNYYIYKNELTNKDKSVVSLHGGIEKMKAWRDISQKMIGVASLLFPEKGVFNARHKMSKVRDAKQNNNSNEVQQGQMF